MNSRRIIQIEWDGKWLFALCDDGTLFSYTGNISVEDGPDSWFQIPPIPQPDGRIEHRPAEEFDRDAD